MDGEIDIGDGGDEDDEDNEDDDHGDDDDHDGLISYGDCDAFHWRVARVDEPVDQNATFLDGNCVPN
jgi:hypothetical protein